MKVKFFATFREMVNLKEIEINYSSSEALTIQQFLDNLIEEYPILKEEIYSDNRTIRKMTHILVNGRNIIHLKGLETLINPTDEIALIPPVGGG